MMRYFVECGLFVVVVVLPYGICMLSAEIHAVTLCPICGTRTSPDKANGRRKPICPPAARAARLAVDTRDGIFRSRR